MSASHESCKMHRYTNRVTILVIVHPLLSEIRLSSLKNGVGISMLNLFLFDRFMPLPSSQ